MKRVLRDYNIYTNEDLARYTKPHFIEEEKEQPYFKREYEGQYAYGVGTLFNEPQILECERRGRESDSRVQHIRPSIRDATRKSLGIDIGWGQFQNCICPYRIRGRNNQSHLLVSSLTDQIIDAMVKTEHTPSLENTHLIMALTKCLSMALHQALSHQLKPSLEKNQST